MFDALVTNKMWNDKFWHIIDMKTQDDNKL